MFRLRAILVALLQFRLKLVFAPLLVVTARTSRGQMEGLFAIDLALIVTGGLIYLVGLAFYDGPSVLAGRFAVAGLIALVPLALLASNLARKCHFGEGSVGSHFLKCEPSADAVGWADAEDEYVWLDTQLCTRFDPRISSTEARAVRDRIRMVLDGVQTHPDYCGLSRVGDTLFRGWLRGVLDPHHCYSYRPEAREPGERFGLLIVLHKENFVFLLHAMRPLCDRQRLVLIAPSFGFGDWRTPEGVEAVDRARRFGVAAFDADPERVFLAGVVEGGAGVTRTAVAYPMDYAGLVFISAAPEGRVTGTTEFVEAWKTRPVLVIHGDRDRKVSPAKVSAACTQLETDGVRVTLHREPEAGHSLFLAKLDEVNTVISNWMDRAVHSHHA